MSGIVAALYVETDGVYFGLPDVDPWDVTRDARLYAGPHPVVAHPPCGPWGRLKFLCTKQDPSCGPRAVEQVRTFGGVLEHPKDSALWHRCEMPRPGELPDAWGGRSYYVEQVSWGHTCVKPTWLYVVGARPELVRAGMRHGGEPTARITNGPRGASARKDLRRASTKECAATPIAFRDFLLSLARASRKTEAS